MVSIDAIFYQMRQEPHSQTWIAVLPHKVQMGEYSAHSQSSRTDMLDHSIQALGERVFQDGKGDLGHNHYLAKWQCFYSRLAKNIKTGLRCKAFAGPEKNFLPIFK